MGHLKSRSVMLISMWLVGGSPLALTFQPGGGACLNCSLACVLLINFLYLTRQVNKFLSFYFCKY